MTQTDRDRLVALKKAKDKKITQRQAAEELQLSERQVRRRLARLGQGGAKAEVHGIRGRSNHRSTEQEEEAGGEVGRRGEDQRAELEGSFGSYEMASREGAGDGVPEKTRGGRAARWSESRKARSSAPPGAGFPSRVDWAWFS